MASRGVSPRLASTRRKPRRPRPHVQLHRLAHQLLPLLLLLLRQQPQDLLLPPFPAVVGPWPPLWPAVWAAAKLRRRRPRPILDRPDSLLLVGGQLQRPRHRLVGEGQCALNLSRDLPE